MSSGIRGACKCCQDSGIHSCCRKCREETFERPDRYSNFLGTSISTFKVIWWSVGVLAILFVISKGTKVVKEIRM